LRYESGLKELSRRKETNMNEIETIEKIETSLKLRFCFEIMGPRFHRLVLCEGKTGPLYERDDLTRDRAASYMTDETGKLFIRVGASFIPASAVMSIEPSSDFPSWAPRTRVPGEAIQHRAAEPEAVAAV